MRKILSILLIIIICIGLAACGKGELPKVTGGEPNSSVVDSSSSSSSSLASSNSSSVSSAESSSKTSSAATSSTTSSADKKTPPKRPLLDADFDPFNKEAYYLIDFNSWQMTLVNPWNSIPEGFNPQLSKVNQKYRPDPNKSSQLYFDARATELLHTMIEAAKYDGITLTVISAYRTNDFQTTNFNNKVDRVMKANPSLTREQAEVEAAKAVARPGTSEHQLGLAVDFNSVEDSFRNTKAYKWLIENCTDFGFILRYTSEKQSKTGIIPEPWHYRYVGVENAKMIEASGLCLEEFIEKYSKK